MFGQHSQGSMRHTKADQIGYATRQGYEVAASKRFGHNRLEFTTADGRRCFMLHETVIAEVSADRRYVTLSDGGWASVTTRRAMSETLAAITGDRYVSVRGARGGHFLWGQRFDRKATFDLLTRKPVTTGRDPYLIRSDTGGDKYAAIEVTFDGKCIRSSGLVGSEIPCSPAQAIRTLRMIFAAIKPHKDKVTPYWWLDRYGIDAGLSVFGFEVGVNGRGRALYIGCHEFKATDMRAMLRRLEDDFPEAAARSRKDGKWKRVHKRSRKVQG